MKPRNKFEQAVLAQSMYLRPITKAQKLWAFRECIDHYAYRLPKGKTTCMDCGHSWQMIEPTERCTGTQYIPPTSALWLKGWNVQKMYTFVSVHQGCVGLGMECQLIFVTYAMCCGIYCQLMQLKSRLSVFYCYFQKVNRVRN